MPQDIEITGSIHIKDDGKLLIMAEGTLPPKEEPPPPEEPAPFDWSQIAIAPSPLNFGAVAIGKEQMMDLLLTNNSARVIDVRDMALNPDTTWLTFVWGVNDWTLAPHSSTPVRLKFAPKSEGTMETVFMCRLYTADKANTVKAVSLKGRGIEAQAPPVEPPTPAPTPVPTPDPPPPSEPPPVPADDGFPATLKHLIRPTPQEWNQSLDQNNWPRPKPETVYMGSWRVAPHIVCVWMADQNVHSFSRGGGNYFDGGLEHVEGDTGAQLQAGEWILEGELRPIKVHRHSTPVNQNWARHGFKEPIMPHLMDIWHYLYLVFPEGTLDDQPYSITHGNETYWLFAPQEQEATTSVIQLNQVGYLPHVDRYAYVSGYMGDGGPLPLDWLRDKATVRHSEGEEFSAPITLRSDNDQASGGPVAQIDLSTIPEGTGWRIHLPGVGYSWPFSITAHGPLKAFYKTARGFWDQRWGRAIEAPYHEWKPERDQDHPFVYINSQCNKTRTNSFYGKDGDPVPPKTGQTNFQAGYHDAGDFDQWQYHPIYTCGYLMAAYEANPDAFYDGQLDLVTKGNGRVDLLNLVEWGLRAWGALQEDSGGVRGGVESVGHPPGVHFADEDQLTYFAYGVRADITARCAGLFAQWSYLGDDPDPWIRKAEKAFQYASAHLNLEELGGPALYMTGELYRATGKAVYRDLFEAIYRANQGNNGRVYITNDAPYKGEFGTMPQPVIGEYLTGYCLANGPKDERIVQVIVEELGLRVDESHNTLKNAYGHRSPRPHKFTPEWGRGIGLMRYLSCAVSLHRITPERMTRSALRQDLSLAFDFIMGGNPMGKAWITGLGFDHPTGVLHKDSLAYIRHGEQPLDGIPPYGPIRDVKSHAGYEYGFHTCHPNPKEWPLMRRYTDIWSNVNCAETDIGHHALMVYLMACLIDPHHREPPAAWAPGQPDHRKTRV